MAKPDSDDKPGKPRKQRAFPWRLWLFAFAMTGTTVLAANYAWQYRKDGRTAGDELTTCRTDLTKVKPQLDDAAKKYDGCNKLLEANNQKIQDQDKRSHEQDVQMTALSNNLSASKDELAALQVQRAEAEKRVAAIADIQKQFAKMIDTGQLKVTARRGALVLSLPSEVLFPSGSADLSESGKMAILEVGFTLKRLSERRFLVVGHTDDQPLKSTTYKDNWELSTARGLTVTRVLVQAGMSPKNLVAAGAGENDPVSKDRAKNRRIEIALLPAINELPPLPASLGDDTAKAEAAPAEKPPAPAPAAAPATPPTKPAAPAPAAPAPAKP
ncbi:MAG TPA: OmpA family protein [Kofleriaceae bacterium]|jgi:chemotaxis protein MotB|nr:OmpA family protein [Kofleriaceae bacterium]